MRPESMRRQPMHRNSSTALIALVFVSGILLGVGPAQADWEAGVAAFKAGKWAAAAAEFKGVTETHPEWPDGYFMLGSALLRLNQPGEAVTSLEKAVELGGAPQHRLTLAQARLQAGQADGALSTLGELSASELDKAYQQPYQQLLAAAAVRSRNPATAIAALEKALRQAPRSAPLWQALGQVRKAAGRNEGAFEAYVKAGELDAGDDTAARLAVQLAFKAAEGASEPASRTWYGRAAQVAEKLATASGAGKDQLLAGEAYLGAGQYPAARTWFEQARLTLPGEALPSYRLGRVALAEKGEEGAGEALGYFDAALAASPGDLASEVHASRALALRYLGRFTDAAAAYRQAGNAGRAEEMEQLAEAAAGNAEYERLAADCRARKARMDQLKEESWNTLAPPDQLRLQQEMDAALAECRPYLEEGSGRG